MANNRRMASKERENYLVDKALDVLADSNYRDATVAKIAAAAGVSEPAIYRYFDSKKDLFMAALDRVRENILNDWSKIVSVTEDPIMALKSLAAYHYQFIKEKKTDEKILLMAISEINDPEIKEHLYDNITAIVAFIAEIIAQGKKRRMLDKDLDETLSAWLITAFGIITIFMSLLGLEEEIDRERLTIAYRRLIDSFIG